MKLHRLRAWSGYLGFLLFVLLLAITWSAEDVTPCKAAHRDVCPTTHLCTSITPVQSVPLYLRMSAEVNVFTCTMEPVSTISMQKALPRYRSDTDNLSAEQTRICTAVRPAYGERTFRTSDYYVYSLERILI